MSFLIRGIAGEGSIRVVAAETTSLVEEARSRHDASPTAAAALGRTLTGALLLSHVVLNNRQDRITIRFRGDGPLGGMIADAGLDGSVRGYAANPHAELPVRADGKLDVGGIVGRGELEVIRSHAPYGDPYSSSVEIVSGEIAEDLAVFLARSEQINSAILLGVYLEKGRVVKAGGILLQALPDAQEGHLETLERNVAALGQLTDALRRDSLLEVAERLTAGLDLEILTKEALPLQFACRCSTEKALDSLAYFTPEEREDMIATEGGAETVCHWCGEKRWLDAEAIRSITQNEIRCPDCNTLWHRQGQALMVREGEVCSCGRTVQLPA
jgi:molecular chaperone Hsp33